MATETIEVQKEPMDSRAVIHAPLWILALVTFSGTLAMHIFVPALPYAGADLTASSGTMQLTISVYILGLAAGQLIYGPLSDRFGRRRTLMAGLVIYSLSGLAAALSPDVDSLIIARLFQALGGCSGMVLGRAMVRDTASAQDASRRLAMMNLIVMIGPGAAPIIGSLLASALGWRSIFFFLCAFGVFSILFCLRLLPETSTSGNNADFRTLARNYAALVKSPAFLGFAIGGGCATTSLYAFIAAAPFIFEDHLHQTARQVGVYLAILISGVWLGSAIMSRLVTRSSIKQLLIGSSLISLSAAAVYLCIVLAGGLSVIAAVASIFVFSVGAGIASPVALTEAISVNAKVIGSASGLYGFTQMMIAALCTALVGLGRDPSISAGIVLVGAALVGQLAFWFALRWKRLGGAA
ncbi:DHA1 family bicyclomycin/chloramphenicol resistance-like MFS transporter [Rhodoligotrophos appendicifer]|uniref:multidrug effflux MFS transporter n=1 Tax=Rhodoligotrophos appendicifer TaxID=987056 RepID=UPI001FE8C3DA|nr:multidrug effflux MFS transporter [Rhodoligotrophos appendicifer]